MLRHLAAGLFSLAVLATAPDAALAERRVALVIGNSAYQNTAPLKNPSNDATDMAEKLRELGFEVIDGTDLSKREMEQRIRTFADKLAGADVGLFFYAGHGLQVDGRNFLAPVDARLNPTPISISRPSSSTSCSSSSSGMPASRSCSSTRAATTRLPTISRWRAARCIGRGLAQVEKAVGMMIAFATQPGNVALDGAGRNSPFTTALLRHIDHGRRGHQ